MRSAAVVRGLRALDHSVVAQDRGNAQPVIEEYIFPAVAGFALPPRQIFSEARLSAVASAFAHGLELPRLYLAVGNRNRDNVLKPVLVQEENSVRIADDKIAGFYGVRADRRATQVAVHAGSKPPCRLLPPPWPRAR